MSIFDKLRRVKKPRDVWDDIPPNERPVPVADGGPGASFPREQTNNEPEKTPAEPYKPAVPKAPARPGPRDEGGDSNEAPSDGEAQDNGSDLSGLYSDFYNSLYSALRAYGVTSIPSFNELYGLLESFLRPAVDAAIEERERLKRQNMAELDADAYARGMGGSSYLSSVKAREMDAAASDAIALEGKYTEAMGEYLYKALSAMQEMEKAFRLASLSASGRTYSGSSGHGSSGGASDAEADEDGRLHADLGYAPYGHTKDGAYFDGVWYEGDFSYLDQPYTYSDYLKYLNTLSPRELGLIFNSDERQWRIKRWQLQYNLTQVDYLDLVARFGNMIAPGGPGGGTPWSQQLY